MINAIEIIVVGSAVAYVAFSVFMQRKLVNMKRLRELQVAIKKKSNELNELARSHGDPQLLMAKQREIMPLLSESMKLQLKPMLVILPILLVIYYVFMPLFIPNIKLDMLGMALTAQEFFIVFTVIFGLVASVITLFYEKKMQKKVETEQNTGSSA